MALDPEGEPGSIPGMGNPTGTGGAGTMPPGGCDPNRVYHVGHPCAPRNGAAGGPCPPGQTRHPTRGDCRYTGDYPCPSGLCKDVSSGACRTFNPRREKVNETDETERGTGGGRGYCKQLSGGGGGGGAGGGGAAGGGIFGAGAGAGGAGAPGTPDMDTGDNFQSIWDSLLPVAQGNATRYDARTMGALEGQARVDQQGNIASDRAAIYDDAIGRGMGRSGATTRTLGDSRRAANQSYTQTVTALRVRKVEKDFEDRMGALDRMQKALDSHQAYLLGRETNAITRENNIANIALGYARIAAERAMLQDRLRVDLEIARNAAMLGLLQNTAPN